MGGIAPHAGVFGRVEDVLHFANALFHGFISAPVARVMWTRVSHPEGCSRTLGWDTPSGEQSSAGHLFSAHTVGHLGFTGTSLWMDLERGIGIVLLTNRVHPTRENEKIRAFRPILHDCVWADLQGRSL
jgi:CubicO group peptidase (beta-lactamase class C family)